MEAALLQLGDRKLVDPLWQPRGRRPVGVVPVLRPRGPLDAPDQQLPVADPEPPVEPPSAVLVRSVVGVST